MNILGELTAECACAAEPAMEPAMALALAASFASVDGWRAAHAAALAGHAGVPGWVALVLRGDGALATESIAAAAAAAAGRRAHPRRRLPAPRPTRRDPRSTGMRSTPAIARRWRPRATHSRSTQARSATPP